MVAGERVVSEELGQGIARVTIRYGFAETPNVPDALRPLLIADPESRPETAVYFISRQTLIPSRRPGMALWRDRLFAALVRNAETPMTYFCLPVNRVVELGTQLEI